MTSVPGSSPDLDELLDNVNEAVMACDQERHVTYWNTGAERLYGWSRAEAIGQLLDDLIYLEPRSLHLAYDQVLQDGRWRGRLSPVRKDGGFVTVESRWKLLRSEADTILGIAISDTDLTEHLALQNRLQHAESAGALSRTVAHELNNILAPIPMSILLLRGSVSGAQAMESLDVIEACARRGAEIVARIRTGNQGLPNLTNLDEAETSHAPSQSPPQVLACIGQLPRGNQELILVVDDDASIRDVCRKTLEAFGYRVHAARDGVEAITLFAQDPTSFAAVLTDIRMPDMDGHALIHALRSITPEVRVIAMSGFRPDGKFSASRWLSKPYTTELLLNTVREVLDA